MRTSRLRDRRRRPPARDGARYRAAAVVARSGDVERDLGRVLRPSDRADSGASHDPGVREHAASCRAAGARAERAIGRRCRHRASRQPVEGAAVRRRGTTQGGHAQGTGGHRVARARDRHRGRRSGMPGRLAAPHRDAAAASGPLGSHRFRYAQGTCLSDVPRRSHRVRGPGACDPAWRARSHRFTRRAARRARAATGRGSGVRGIHGRRALRSDAPRLAVSRARQVRLRRRRDDGRGGHCQPARTSQRDGSSRRSARHGARPERLADAGDRVGRRDPGGRRLSRRARSRGDLHRHAERGLRDREQYRRHLSARQRLVAGAAGRDRHRPRRRRQGRATEPAVLAR